MLPLRTHSLCWTIVFSGLLLCHGASGTESGPGVADNIQPFEATYGISISGVPLGMMTRTFRLANDNTYEYVSDTRSNGIISLIKKVHIKESSSGVVSANQYNGVAYRYRSEEGSKVRSFTAQTAWPEKTMSQVIDDQREVELNFEELLFDRLNYQLQLMLDVRKPYTDLRYPIGERGKLKEFNFRYLGEESITTPFGQIDTVKFERGTKADKRQTTLWCAPSLDNLPVKVVYRDKKQLTEAVLRTYEK